MLDNPGRSENNDLNYLAGPLIGSHEVCQKTQVSVALHSIGA